MLYRMIISFILLISINLYANIDVFYEGQKINSFTVEEFQSVMLAAEETFRIRTIESDLNKRIDKLENTEVKVNVIKIDKEDNEYLVDFEVVWIYESEVIKKMAFEQVIIYEDNTNKIYEIYKEIAAYATPTLLILTVILLLIII